MESPTLELTPGATHLVVADPDRLHVVDLSTGASTLHVVPGLRAFTTIGDELWIAAGDPAMIEIVGHAERLPLSGASGRFVRGVGARAVWLGTRVMHVGRTTGGLDVRPVHDIDFALPLGATRFVACTQHVIQLCEATTTRWSVAPVVDGRVCEGAAISDGRAVALYIAQRGDRGTIVVLDAASGALQHRIHVRGASLVRFASRRGVAVVVVERRRLVMIDLRYGRILADHAHERDIAEVAIDPAAQQIALRYDERFGEVVQLQTEELLRAPSPAHAIDVDDIAPEPEEVAVPTSEPVRPTAPITLPPCPALTRLVRELPTHEQLAAHRAWVVALLRLAIARAWDEGRATPDRPTAQRNLVESIAGLLRGLAAEDVTRAHDCIEAAEAGWRDANPLQALAAEHGLDRIAEHILAVVAAPVLWGELAPLFGMLVADHARPLCDELLLSTVLAPIAQPSQIAAALDADAPLARLGLIQIGHGLGRPFLPLVVNPVVARVLLGASPCGELGVAVAVRAATRAFEELHLRDDVKLRIVDALAHATAPLRIVVRGRAGSGRHTLLATIADGSERALAVLDVAALLRPHGATVDDVRTVLHRAVLAGLVPCLDGLERVVEPALRDQLRDLLRGFAGPVTVRLPPDAACPLEPGYVAIDLPAQTPTERATTWTEALARNGVTADPDELAVRFAIGPAVIERVTARVARDGSSLDGAIRQHLDSDLTEVATRVHRLATWSQVILPPDIQDSVTELIGRIRHRRKVFDAWGFDRVMSTSRGVTALFQGGPGTGKTLVASAIANELGLDLYRVDVSRIMSKWIGETEQRLAKLFDAAEDGNAIILFDEADSLFGKRTEVKSSVDRYANVEVNYLLQRLDSFGGIAILTSNLGSSIDSAFKRRLSFRLTFPFPDEEQREQLWRAHLPAQLPIRGELGLTTLAQRYRLSGGYIRNCALRAAFLAAEQGGSLTADHLERAIKAEFREIGKLAETGALE